MWNCMVSFVRRGVVGTEDGTPVYGTEVVYSGVKGRVDVQAQSSTLVRTNTERKHMIRKSLLVKATHNGQVLQLDYDMVAVIDGQEHDIIAIAPAGASKPMFLELTLVQVVSG